LNPVKWSDVVGAQKSKTNSLVFALNQVEQQVKIKKNHM
jgi:hypothetical protein